MFRKQRAFGLVEKLRNEYEIAEDIATEAIIAWCLIPVHDAVANALEKPPVQSSRPLDGHPLSLTTGIYRAGNDIPIGTLLLRYDGETLQTFFYICEKFQKQTHIEIAEGEYLVLDGYDAVDGFVLTATKME